MSTPAKAVCLLAAIAVLTGGAALLRAQSALGGFDPNANGTVNVIVVQPDGKILIAGSFTSLASIGGASVTRNRVVRLNPDETLDTAFNPNASGFVGALAVRVANDVLWDGAASDVPKLRSAIETLLSGEK